MQDLRNEVAHTGPDEFQIALQGEDELGVVLRAHLYIEATLNSCIEKLLPRPEVIDKMNLDYHQRVTLAVAAGLNPRFERPLIALGTLRNAFAHRVGTKLTKDRVNSVYEALSSEDKSMVQQAHNRTRRSTASTPKVPAFSRLAPKDQFILLAVTVRAILEVGIRQASAGSDS